MGLQTPDLSRRGRRAEIRVVSAPGTLRVPNAWCWHCYSITVRSMFPLACFVFLFVNMIPSHMYCAYMQKCCADRPFYRHEYNFLPRCMSLLP